MLSKTRLSRFSRDKLRSTVPAAIALNRRFEIEDGGLDMGI